MLCWLGTGAAAQEVTVLYGIRSNPGVERIPVNPPYHYRVAPRPEPAAAGVRIIEIAPETPGSGFAALRPARSGDPVADLIADPTLRPGDVAMFADGARVFTGAPHGRRELSDFAPAASAARLLPPSVRDHVLSLRPAATQGWAAAALAPRAPSRPAPALHARSGFEIVRVTPR